LSDIERDLEDLGQRVWPNPEEIRRRALSGNQRARRRFRGAAGIVGTVAAMGLIGGVSAVGILQLQHHLAASPTSTSPTPRAVTGGPGVGAVHVGIIGSSAQASPAATGHLWPPPSSSPSPGVHPPPAGGTLTITQNSQGTFVVTRGMTIRVDLAGGTAGYTWSIPSSTPNQIVHFASGSHTSGGVVATFVAAASGQATIQAALSPDCSRTCGRPAYLWQIHITVVP
jgi:hypothetical protein